MSDISSQSEAHKTLVANDANFTALSPLSFIKRTARVFPEYPSIIYQQKTYTWAQTYKRCKQLASALLKLGVSHGDTVAVIAPNTPQMFELHFAVPMAGAVLNTLNTRLDAPGLGFILEHADVKLLFADTEYSDLINETLQQLEAPPRLIDIDDVFNQASYDSPLSGLMEYEALLATGDDQFAWQLPDNEWDSISINYTSGTTGDPKGVVYHHRGAYLNALGNATGWGMPQHARYLWTLPMFHCNGWCFPWTLAAIAGVSICMRRVNAANIYQAIAEQKITHFCGAPIVLGFVINASETEKRQFDHQVNIMTAAAPPPASVLRSIEAQGFNVTHAYGLTETYGPAAMCAWKDVWNELPDDERAEKKARQGVPYHVLEDMQVLHPETLKPVPWDGETVGEIMFRGNIVMKGYYKNAKTSATALAGGWFHSGDLAVMQPDGYIKIKDRSKDVIISGGENISSLEVENTLYKHPAVLEVAVVARPDEKWGETPCAFVMLKTNAKTTEQELINFCRDNLAHYKCPKTVVFTELPKTSTGKVQKYLLRQQAEELS